MKRLFSFLIIFAMLLAILPVSGISANGRIDDTAPEKVVKTSFTPHGTFDSRNEEGKYLILNEDGSYGGSLNDVLYGKGAPYNGEYEVENSDYYLRTDYYNMKSSTVRHIFPKFSSYQQTMQDSSGIACILMVLNYLGHDVTEFSELNLVKAYEQLNETTVFGNGTTPQGLANLVNSLELGYTANTTEHDVSSYDIKKEDFESTQSWIESCVKDGKFLLLRYQSPNGFGWKLVTGYDNFGKYEWSFVPNYYATLPGDDVVIFAEPNDNFDHYQDGYTVARVSNVCKWWFDMSYNGTVSNKCQYVVIDPNIDVEFEIEEEDLTPCQPLTEIYLPLNDEGFKGGVKYGGSRDTALYGYITTGDGVTDRTNKPYYKITDFYNMGSEGSRLLLKNYTVLQQTMSSSCGVCAVTAVLKYYGHEGSYFDLELEYTNAYDNHPGIDDVVRGGTSNGYHKILLKDWGYASHHYRSLAGEEPPFVSYENFASFVKYNIKNNRPIVVSASPKGGHFLTIIGIDDMGTDYIYDDVVVIADSSDYWDNYQDGYNIYPATQFYRQFANQSLTYLQQCLVIYDKK